MKSKVNIDWDKISDTRSLMYLSTAEAANREGVLPRTLQKRLLTDAKKPQDKRRYPGAYRCQCGHGWFVPESELKQQEQE